MTLAVLISTHRGPLTADLHRFHGLRLADIASSEFTVEEVADFAGNLPPDSATARALDPEWQLTSEVYLLRAIEHDLRVLAWQKTKDATLRAPQNYPDPLPLSAADLPEPEPGYDATPIEDMADFLGWPRPD